MDTTLSNGWYVSREHEMLGPLADSELRQRVERGLVSPHDYVWREGQVLWLLVTEVPALKAAIRTSSPAGHEQTRVDARAEHTRRDEANKVARSKGAVGKAGASPKVSRPNGPNWSAPGNSRGSEQTSRPSSAGKPAASGTGAPDLGRLREAAEQLVRRTFGGPTQLALILVAAGIMIPPLLVPLWFAAYLVWSQLRK